MTVRKNKYMEKILKWVKQHHVLMLAICVLFILRPKFVEWIKEYVCPLTPKEINNNGWVLAIVIVAIGIAYLTHIKRLLKERELVVSRLWTMALLFGGWCIFRYADAFDFYGIEGWIFNYIDCAWLTIACIEIGLFGYRCVQKKRREGEVDGSPFMKDAPVVKDEMNRERYAVQLIKKIKAGKKERKDGVDSGRADGAFTILLNESYGVGKTSFMMQLERIAEGENVDVCWFKPWLYEDSRTMMVNFVRVLQEKLGEGDGLLQQMLNKYAQVLSSFKGYEIFSLLHFEGTSVETQFEDIKAKLQEKQQPIIVLIDDVDRLQSDELLRMLQMVRNMGDFPYIYYIIAADKAAVQNRLSETGIAEPDVYLKKFFNLEMHFPADDRMAEKVLYRGLSEISMRYRQDGEKLREFIQKLRYGKDVFANIRDIKRFLNAFDFALANFQAVKTVNGKTMLDEISLRDLAGLCMIQCVDSEFYLLLRDHNEHVLEYKDWHYKVKSDFAEIFTDRHIKKMIDSVAAQSVNEQNKPKDTVKDEIEESVNTLSELIQWTKPKKVEVIGELLGILFPQSHASESRLGICHPTEYYKYFSTMYKGNEFTNAEVIGIMRFDEDRYITKIKGVLKENEIDSFKHKLTWYLQTQSYDRIGALLKVMIAFELEWQANNLTDTYKELMFMQNYGASLFAIFYKRKDETAEQCKKAWDEIRRWLITTKEYERRIIVLMMLAKHVENYASYIFETREEVTNCVQESEKQFIYEVWLKDMFNPEVYKHIPPYREIDPTISEYIIEGVQRKHKENGLMMHLVKYDKGEIDWNKEFIEAVLGTHLVFAYDTSLWLQLVPAKWQQECRRWNMNVPITKDEITHSAYLKSVLQYWTSVMELSRSENERLLYVLKRGNITPAEYEEECNVHGMRVTMELNKFARLGYLEKKGIGKKAKYVNTNLAKFEE